MGQFSKYDALIECCERLDALGIVGWCMDDNGHENNHWSGTLAAMREHLGRQLTDEIAFTHVVVISQASSTKTVRRKH